MKQAFRTFLIMLLLDCVSFSQQCPRWDEKAALLKFLQDNETRSLEADPECVLRAFTSLGRDEAYTVSLVRFLDFERSTKTDEKLMHRGNQYPAIIGLAHPHAIPSLIKVIKASDSELVRINASYTLDRVYEACDKTVIMALNKELSKAELTGEEQTRLRDAESTITKSRTLRGCKTEAPRD